MKKISFIVLICSLSLPCFSQDVSWLDLFDLYQGNELLRSQKLTEMGFTLESTQVLQNKNKTESFIYKAKKLGKGGMWFEKIIIFKGLKQLTFITENTTLNESLKKELTGKYRFVENVEHALTVINEEVIYTRDSSKIGLFSKPGDDGQTDHYISIKRYFGDERNYKPIFLANSRYHAVLIGVDTYQDQTYNLSWTAGNVNKLKDILVEKYNFKSDHVHTLTGSPTRNQILNQLEDLRSLGEDDNLFIFYTGHGSYDAKAGEGYWLPSDGNTSNRSTSISNSDILTRIKGLSCGHVLIISDACSGGAIFRFKPLERSGEKSISEQYQIRSRQAITSAGLKKSPDTPAFIENLLRVFNKNGLDYLSASAIFSSIFNKLDELRSTDPGIAIPEYGHLKGTDDQGGEFIFKLKE